MYDSKHQRLAKTAHELEASTHRLALAALSARAAAEQIACVARESEGSNG